jgi:hypothetical protein
MFVERKTKWLIFDERKTRGLIFAERKTRGLIFDERKTKWLIFAEKTRGQCISALGDMGDRKDERSAHQRVGG